VKVVHVTENECWAVEYTVRSRELPETRRLERDLLLKIMALLVEFEDRHGKPFPPTQLPLALTEEECWLIVQRVPLDVVLSGEHAGRTVLLKTFRILLEYANEREAQGGVATLVEQLRLRSSAAPNDAAPPAEDDTSQTEDESAEPRQEPPVS
jgi:hypothetical protein